MNRDDCFDLLKSTLSALINDDYIFLDLPYFSNVGDILIWQATLDILKEIPYKCLYSASSDTYVKPVISEKTPILFMGGGNFGDLWVKHQVFRHKILNDFPQNPIIQLPQSVYFSSAEMMEEDIEIFSKHQGEIVICTRDLNSYKIISNEYSFAKSLLLPDLVLSLNIDKYTTKGEPSEKILFVKRNDSEFTQLKNQVLLPPNVEIADWPCMYSDIFEYRVMLKIDGFMKRLPLLRLYRMKMKDFFYKHILRLAYIHSGIKFLIPYKTIYSTRLHAAILGFLLGKEVYMLDNSYGKCSGVYDLWLEDQSNIKML